MRTLISSLCEVQLRSSGKTADLLTAALEACKKALSKLKTPYRWMRFSKFSTEYGDVTAYHGSIPRKLRHGGENYGGGRVDPEVEAYNKWQQDIWKIQSKLKKQFPGVRFSTEAE